MTRWSVPLWVTIAIAVVGNAGADEPRPANGWTEVRAAVSVRSFTAGLTKPSGTTGGSWLFQVESPSECQLAREANRR